MQENEVDRERRLRELASKLLFTIERRGSRFALYRDVDVPKPVRHDDLTLDEVEDIYSTHGNFVGRTVAEPPNSGEIGSSPPA
jgi:hypothetical protein